MQRYEHGGDIYGNPGVLLDFSVNTNPLGLPEVVRQALVNRADEFTHYPDPLCRELCIKIASYEELPVEWVLCGNGAADLIYRLCYALKPRRAMVCAPTFSEYERALKQAGAQVMYHMLEVEDEFDLTEEILEKITRYTDILFLCHPNNPTSRLISNTLMERIMHRVRQTGTLLVVDECFLDFTNGESAKSFLNAMPELCIIKAFTKIYAMAGLRLGYMLTSNRRILHKTRTTAQCWSVSVPAQIAGIAALTCEGWQKKTLDLIEKERTYMSERLENLGITVFPGEANYLLLRYELPLYNMLLEKGILIRTCYNFVGLDGSYYRIGIKKRNENNRLIKAVEDCISQQR